MTRNRVRRMMRTCHFDPQKEIVMNLTSEERKKLEAAGLIAAATKPKPPSRARVNHTCGIYLYPKEWAVIDEARRQAGPISRNAFINAVVAEWLRERGDRA